jgi:hypothetical protein
VVVSKGASLWEWSSWMSSSAHGRERKVVAMSSLNTSGRARNKPSLAKGLEVADAPGTWETGGCPAQFREKKDAIGRRRE